MRCRACGGSLREVLDLGTHPPANSLLLTQDQPEKAYPLVLMVCLDCHLMQTSFDVSPHELFNGSYPYFSGQSKQWVEHCKSFSEGISVKLGLSAGSYIIEIGGNDGTLLKNFEFCSALNIEPSASVAEASRQSGVPTWQGGWEDYEDTRLADLIVGNNVLAHTPRLRAFVESTARHLAPNGTATFEFPWALNLLEECQFDTVYHEHYSYLSLTALIPLFRDYELNITHAESISTHGGSLRIYVKHWKQEASSSVASLLEQEKLLANQKTYRDFRERALRIRDALRKFVKEHKPLYGYGAAAKGNTLLNWAGITPKEMLAVADTTPAKHGKFLPGSRIPIITEAELVSKRPKHVLVLPWNWKTEIAEKLYPILPYTKIAYDYIAMADAVL